MEYALNVIHTLDATTDHHGALKLLNQVFTNYKDVSAKTKP